MFNVTCSSEVLHHVLVTQVGTVQIGNSWTLRWSNAIWLESDKTWSESFIIISSIFLMARNRPYCH